MNTYYLILKGTNKELAITEFETLFETYYNTKVILKKVENTLYTFSTNVKLHSKDFLYRLTYTNYIGIKIEEDNFSKYEGKTFRVRIKKSNKEIKHTQTEQEIAKIVWNKLKNPKVDLENPQFEINYFITKDKSFFCEKIFENKKEYLKRMPKKRPVSMPFTLKSDMARVAVNLLGIKKGIVLDPFCGIGGTLLEAEDMNLISVGSDLSWRDLLHLKTNWKFFYPKTKPNLIISDATTQIFKQESIDGIVTDIPYGKSSSKKGDRLYEEFLRNSHIYLKKGKRLVVIYANFVDFRSLTKKYFKEIAHIEQYINKSMTRYIIVLEKK